jgi:hypothetical protein
METIRSIEADQLSQYLIAISFIFGCRCFLSDVARMISCYTFQCMGRYAAALSIGERIFCSKVKSLSFDTSHKIFQHDAKHYNRCGMRGSSVVGD